MKLVHGHGEMCIWREKDIDLYMWDLDMATG